jgi:hypothetical protein
MTTRKKDQTKIPGVKYARAVTINEDQCVWMRARVVNFKLCNNTYDCADCAFDKAMSEAWKPSRDLGST